MDMIEDNRNIDSSVVEIFLYKAPKKIMIQWFD